MPTRKIILNLCTSLDSFIEGENGEIDWCFTDQDYSMTGFLSSIDTIFFGRKSYTQLIESWPNAFPGKKRVVFSKTLQIQEQDTIVISSKIDEEINNILRQPGKNIWLFGGAEITTFLLNIDLVNELIISVHPLILGKGKPLINAVEQRKQLKLNDVKTFSTGLVQLYYSVLPNKF
jgi:dihydrofolate reductase